MWWILFVRILNELQENPIRYYIVNRQFLLFPFGSELCMQKDTITDRSIVVSLWKMLFEVHYRVHQEWYPLV